MSCFPYFEPLKNAYRQVRYFLMSPLSRTGGASFRQIQQRYEPHPGTLRAIEIVENSPTYSERPQPTAHASRDRAHHPQSTWNGIEENSGR